MKGDEGPTRHHGKSQPMAASTLDLLPWRAPTLPADDVVGKMATKVCAVWKHKSFIHAGAARLDPVTANLVEGGPCGMGSHSGPWTGSIPPAALAQPPLWCPSCGRQGWSASPVVWCLGWEELLDRAEWGGGGWWRGWWPREELFGSVVGKEVIPKPTPGARGGGGSRAGVSPQKC